MTKHDVGVNELLDTLLNSANDAWRDDAAQALARAADRAQAEQALLDAIASPKLDDSLRITCAESLADIWIQAGGASSDKLGRLDGTAREVALALLRAAGLG